MEIFFEAILVIWTVSREMIKCFFTIVVKNLPFLLEMKQIFGIFTPVGMIALYLGIPTIVVTLMVKFVKKLF